MLNVIFEVGEGEELFSQTLAEVTCVWGEPSPDKDVMEDPDMVGNDETLNLRVSTVLRFWETLVLRLTMSSYARKGSCRAWTSLRQLSLTWT